VQNDIKIDSSKSHSSLKSRPSHGRRGGCPSRRHSRTAPEDFLAGHETNALCQTAPAPCKPGLSVCTSKGQDSGRQGAMGKHASTLVYLVRRGRVLVSTKQGIDRFQNALYTDTVFSCSQGRNLLCTAHTLGGSHRGLPRPYTLAACSSPPFPTASPNPGLARAVHAAAEQIPPLSQNSGGARKIPRPHQNSPARPEIPVLADGGVEFGFSPWPWPTPSRSWPGETTTLSQ